MATANNQIVSLMEYPNPFRSRRPTGGFSPAEKARIDRVFQEAAAIEVIRGTVRLREADEPYDPDEPTTSIGAEHGSMAVSKEFECAINEVVCDQELSIAAKLKKIEKLLRERDAAVSALKKAGAVRESRTSRDFARAMFGPRLARSTADLTESAKPAAESKAAAFARRFFR